jgi:hypothetical protein
MVRTEQGDRRVNNLGILCRKCIQKFYIVAEIIIVFAVVALHVVSMLPGLLHIRKRPRTV